MNNLRQQAVARQQGGPAAAAAAAVAVAAAAASQPQARDAGSPINMNLNGPVAPRMGQQQVQQARPVGPVQPVIGGMQPFSQQVSGTSMSPTPFAQQVNGASMSPTSFAQQPPNHNIVAGANNGAPGGASMMHTMNQNRNTNALQDYQMQLMLLEKQNKRRLDIARNNGAADLNLSMQLVQQPQIQNKLQQHPPKASPAPSPVQNSKLSPVITVSKAKKAPAAKKSRKPSVAATHTTPLNTGVEANLALSNGRPAGGVSKKEYSTPLTPAAEVDSSKKKRKSSGGDSPKKQIKANAAVKKEKPAPKPKKEEAKSNGEASDFGDDRLDAEGNKMPPPNSAYFTASLGNNDKMISVDILGGDSVDGNFFAANSGMDDFDFSFLEGGDNSLNDTMGFAWNNPIEGGD